MTLVSCNADRLDPPETFEWGVQAIAFTPPSPRWRREQENQGGKLGVRFTRTGSVGECMTFATDRLLGEHDRRAALDRLLSHLRIDEPRQVQRQISLARARTDDPLSLNEAAASGAINAALDRALSAHLAGRIEEARDAVGEARNAADSYHLALSDVLERVRFRPDARREPWRYRVTREGKTTIAGHPAYAVDYTLEAPERQLRCRELYVVVNNGVFSAGYQGLPSHLGLFERVVGTIAFPSGAGDATR